MIRFIFIETSMPLRSFPRMLTLPVLRHFLSRELHSRDPVVVGSDKRKLRQPCTTHVNFFF